MAPSISVTASPAGVAGLPASPSRGSVADGGMIGGMMSGRKALEVVGNFGNLDWVLIGPDPENLPFVGGGSGGVAEMQSNLEACQMDEDNANLYGLLRLEYTGANLSADEENKCKFVAVRFTQLSDDLGAISVIKQGQLASVKGAMEKSIYEFAHCVLTLEVNDVEDFTLKDLLPKLIKASPGDAEYLTEESVCKAREKFAAKVEAASADGGQGESYFQTRMAPPKARVTADLSAASNQRRHTVLAWQSTSAEEALKDASDAAASDAAVDREGTEREEALGDQAMPAVSPFHVHAADQQDEVDVQLDLEGGETVPFVGVVPDLYVTAAAEGHTPPTSTDPPMSAPPDLPPSAQPSYQAGAGCATPLPVDEKDVQAAEVFHSEAVQALQQAIDQNEVQSIPSESRREHTNEEPTSAPSVVVPKPQKTKLNVPHYDLGQIVLVYCPREKKWFDDGVVIRRLVEPAVADGIKLKAGSLKVHYNNYKQYSWLFPAHIRTYLAPSERPRPPVPGSGELYKQTHSFFSKCHIRYFDLKEGYLRWWHNVDQCHRGRKPCNEIFLQDLEIGSEGSTFWIKTKSTKQVVFNFDATTAEGCESWSRALLRHGAWCKLIIAYDNNKSKFPPAPTPHGQESKSLTQESAAGPAAEGMLSMRSEGTVVPPAMQAAPTMPGLAGAAAETGSCD